MDTKAVVEALRVEPRNKELLRLIALELGCSLANEGVEELAELHTTLARIQRRDTPPQRHDAQASSWFTGFRDALLSTLSGLEQQQQRRRTQRRDDEALEAKVRRESWGYLVPFVSEEPLSLPDLAERLRCASFPMERQELLLGLTEMEAEELIERIDLQEEQPLYRLTPRGQRLSRRLGRTQLPPIRVRPISREVQTQQGAQPSLSTQESLARRHARLAPACTGARKRVVTLASESPGSELLDDSPSYFPRPVPTGSE